MVSKKIIFLGSKPIGYECLVYLIAQKDALNIEISGIMTRSRSEFGNSHDLKYLARENNIPVLNDLNQLPECDIIYSVQYHEVLKKEHIDKAKQITVNLHMAPLPEYRGSNQFSFAIIEHKTEFGTTIHKIDTQIDHGDILFQKRFPIPENCWVGKLYEITFLESLILFKQTLPGLVNGRYSPVPQESLIPKYGTSLHYRSEMDAIKVIDLSWDKEKMERYIRATSMPGFGPPYCLVDGKKIYFTPEE